MFSTRLNNYWNLLLDVTDLICNELLSFGIYSLCIIGLSTSLITAGIFSIIQERNLEDFKAYGFERFGLVAVVCGIVNLLNIILYPYSIICFQTVLMYSKHHATDWRLYKQKTNKYFIDIAIKINLWHFKNLRNQNYENHIEITILIA